MRDFYDRVEVEKVYYPEIEALLKEATGAEKVVVFDHQVRNIELSKQGKRTLGSMFEPHFSLSSVLVYTKVGPSL